MLAFSFNICLDFFFIKPLRLDKRCIIKNLPKYNNRLLRKFFKFTQVYFNPISFTLSRVFNFQHLILFAAFFVKVYPHAFANIYDFPPKSRGVGGGTLLGMGLYFRMLSSSSASGIKLWN